MNAENGTIILVHGAWADGSCWQNIILPLHHLGLDVVCAPLPLTSLTDDIAALSRALERTNGPVVLVGHAYAGAVIAGPSEDRIKALVYVAALAPGDGETVGQVFYREKPHPDAPHLAPDRHGFIWMPEEGFRKAVAHKASADQKIISTALQRPIALKCIQDVTPKPAWLTKPTWYLLVEEDRMINPATQRFMAERMGAKNPLPSGGPYSDVHSAGSCGGYHLGGSAREDFNREGAECDGRVAIEALRTIQGTNHAEHLLMPKSYLLQV